MEKGLGRRLEQDPDIASLTSTRVYAGKLPQSSVLPAIAFANIDGSSQHDLDGPTGERRARYQVSGWANAYADVKTLQGYIAACLDGFRGDLPDGTEVLVLRLISDRGPFVEDFSERWRVDMDFDIWYCQI
jgi:hypothetical protein